MAKFQVDFTHLHGIVTSAAIEFLYLYKKLLTKMTHIINRKDNIWFEPKMAPSNEHCHFTDSYPH